MFVVSTEDLKRNQSHQPVKWRHYFTINTKHYVVQSKVQFKGKLPGLVVNVKDSQFEPWS